MNADRPLSSESRSGHVAIVQATYNNTIKDHVAASATFLALTKEREAMQGELRRAVEASGLSMGNIARLSSLTDAQLRHEPSGSVTSAVLNAVALHRALEQTQARVEKSGSILETSMQQFLTGKPASGPAISLSSAASGDDSRDAAPDPPSSLGNCTTISTTGLKFKADDVLPDFSSRGASGFTHYLGSGNNDPSPPSSWATHQHAAAAECSDPKLSLPNADTYHVLGETLSKLRLGQQLQQQQAGAPTLQPIQEQLIMSSCPMSDSNTTFMQPSSTFDFTPTYSDVAGQYQSTSAFDFRLMMGSSIPPSTGIPSVVGGDISADVMGGGIESLILQQSLTDMQLSAWRQQQQRQIDEAMCLMQQQQQINETMAMMKASPPVVMDPHSMAGRPHTIPAALRHGGMFGLEHHHHMMPQPPPPPPMQIQMLQQRQPIPGWAPPPPPPPPPMTMPSFHQNSYHRQQRSSFNAQPAGPPSSVVKSGRKSLSDPKSLSAVASGGERGSGGYQPPLKTGPLVPLPPHAVSIDPSLIKSSHEALREGLVVHGGPTNIFAPTQQFLMCKLCRVQCTSEMSMDQHLVSKKHLSKSARMVAIEAESTARDLRQAAGIEEVSDPLDPELDIPCTEVHELCKQVITPELNRAVVELLIKVRDFQREQDQHVGGDQTGGSDGNASGENGDAIADQVSTMTTSAVSSSRKWYVCGLKEVKKAIKLGEAKSIILAANIEQWELSNGNVDEQVADILKNGEEKGIPVIFALSRKRLGLVYGSYRLVSAVAIMDVVDAGAEEEHNRVVELMMRGDSKRVRK